MLDSLHAWGGFPKRLLLGEADVTAHSYLYKTSYNAAHRHGHIGVHYTTCKLLSLACWCRAHLVEWSHQGFGRFLLQYGNRAPFSCPFQQTSGQYRSLSKRANLKEPDILYDQAFHRVQMRPTHCAPYQYYFDRNSCLMVACQYFDICIWRECCNAVMSICRSMEGVKKHPSICLLLSAMKIHNICCGHSTLKGVTFGTSVSVSDVQYTVSNLLSISLVGWPLMDKNVQQTLFIATSGHSCCGLVMLTASWPLLPLLSLSLFFIEISGYWSRTKSTLVASPACNKILLNTISAKSENLSGILLSICSIAIACVMTADVWAGRCWRLSTPSSRRLGKQFF